MENSKREVDQKAIEVHINFLNPIIHRQLVSRLKIWHFVKTPKKARGAPKQNVKKKVLKSNKCWLEMGVGGLMGYHGRRIINSVPGQRDVRDWHFDLFSLPFTNNRKSTQFSFFYIIIFSDFLTRIHFQLRNFWLRIWLDRSSHSTLMFN